MPVRSILSRCGLAALLSLAACHGNSIFGSSDSGGGRISFTYAGAESGRFVAKGDADNDSDREYAVASLFDPPGGFTDFILIIDGSMRLDNGSDAKIRIVAPAGVSTAACSPGVYGCRTSAELLLNARGASPDEGRVYRDRFIEVEVSEFTEQRARGTFTMTAEQLSPSDGSFTGRTIEVRSGEFDVPIVPLAARSASASLTPFR